MQIFLSMAGNRAVDDHAIHTCDIPGTLLMGNAGRAAVEQMLDKNMITQTSTILVLTGKGNNGGDGFVIAADLLGKGYKVAVISMIPPESVRGDAQHYLTSLLSMNPQFEVWSGTDTQISMVHEADIIVDALLGTGVKGTLRPPYDEVISHVNASPAVVVAIDLPSGVTGDLGLTLNPCIQADFTNSMGYGKQACLFEPARGKSGELSIVDIGFPPDSCEHVDDKRLFRIQTADFPPNRFTRAADSHKYSTGKVFVVAGSKGFSGAAILASKAALRSGAGLVRLAVPTSLGAIVETCSLETVVDYVEESPEQGVSKAALPALHTGCEWADVVALGPGLGRQLETQSVVLDLIKRVHRPMVIDADGLYPLIGRTDLLLKRSAPTILTPHAGEFKRLAGMEKGETPNWQHALAFATKHKVFVLLKGAPSLLVTPEGAISVNNSGYAGMATAGSGDVLTGLIASLWSQWPQDPEVLNFAMHIHGKAAESQRASKGTLGLIAGDIVEALPLVLKEYGGLPT